MITKKKRIHQYSEKYAFKIIFQGHCLTKINDVV